MRTIADSSQGSSWLKLWTGCFSKQLGHLANPVTMCRPPLRQAVLVDVHTYRAGWASAGEDIHRGFKALGTERTYHCGVASLSLALLAHKCCRPAATGGVIPVRPI